MNTKIKTILGIMIFVVFIGAAYFAYNMLSDKFKPNSELQITENTPQQRDVKKIPAPDFTIIDSEGNQVKLSDFIGKAIVINFWASWCPPCRSEMPHFDKVYANVKDDIVFLMIDMVDGNRETVAKGKKYITDSGYSFPVYFDTKQDAAGTMSRKSTS